jgi:hypothetical protein
MFIDGSEVSRAGPSLLVALRRRVATRQAASSFCEIITVSIRQARPIGDGGVW